MALFLEVCRRRRSSTQQKSELKLCLAPAKVAESQTNAIPGGCGGFPPSRTCPKMRHGRRAHTKKTQNCSGRVLRSRCAVAVARPIIHTHAGSDTLWYIENCRERPQTQRILQVEDVRCAASPFCTAQVLPKFGRREKLIFLKWKVLFSAGLVPSWRRAHPTPQCISSQRSLRAHWANFKSVALSCAPANKHLTWAANFLTSLICNAKLCMEIICLAKHLTTTKRQGKMWLMSGQWSHFG